MAAKQAAAMLGSAVRYLPLAVLGYLLVANGRWSVIAVVAAAMAAATFLNRLLLASFESASMEWKDLASSTLLIPLIMSSSGEQLNTSLLAVVAALILSTPVFLQHNSLTADWRVDMATSSLLLLVFLCLRCPPLLGLALLLWANCGRHRPTHLCKQETMFYFHTVGLILFDVITSNAENSACMPPFSPRTALWVSEVALVALLVAFGLSQGLQPLLGSSRSEEEKFAVFLGALCLVVGLWAWPWLTPVLGIDPLSWLVALLLENSGDVRVLLAMVGWWLASIAITVFIGHQPSLSENLGRTITRKFFHLLVVLMFYPAFAFSAMNTFLVLAIGGALCVFLLAEYLRVKLMPHRLQSCSSYFALFLDPLQPPCGLVTSHLTLLLAVGGPILLAPVLAPIASSAAWPSDVEGYWKDAGLVTVGVGDAVAAVVGVCWGRTRWPQSNKTLEGSLAGGLAMLVVAVAVAGCTTSASLHRLAIVLLATLAEVFVEGNDNLSVPTYTLTLFLLLRWAYPAA